MEMMRYEPDEPTDEHAHDNCEEGQDSSSHCSSHLEGDHSDADAEPAEPATPNIIRSSLEVNDLG